MPTYQARLHIFFKRCYSPASSQRLHQKIAFDYISVSTSFFVSLTGIEGFIICSIHTLQFHETFFILSIFLFFVRLRNQEIGRKMARSKKFECHSIQMEVIYCSIMNWIKYLLIDFTIGFFFHFTETAKNCSLLLRNCRLETMLHFVVGKSFDLIIKYLCFLKVLNWLFTCTYVSLQMANKFLGHRNIRQYNNLLIYIST